MKKRHFFTIAIAFIMQCSVQIAHAQSPSQWPPILDVDHNRKPAYYLRKAKSSLKKDDLPQSLFYTIIGLQKVKKKGQERKLKGLLNENYEPALSILLKNAEDFGKKSPVWESDKSTFFKWQVFRHLKSAEKINQETEKLAKKFISKLNFIKPKGIPEAESNLDSFRMRSAVYHYAIADSLSRFEEKAKKRRCAGEYKLSCDYAKYRDNKLRYDSMKVEATTRMLVGGVRNESGKRIQNSEALGSKLVAGLLQITEFKHLPYFAIYNKGDNKQDVILNIKITDMTVEDTQASPYVQDHEEEIVTGTRKVGEKTVEIKQTVKATSTIYQKWKNTVVGGTYEIVDAKTGEVLHAGNWKGQDSWTTQWGNFRGNPKALSSSTRSIVMSKPQQAPTPDVLYSKATNDAVAILGEKVLQYARSVGY